MAVSERARVLAGGLALAFFLAVGGGEAAAQSAVCSSTPATGQRIDCREGSGSAADIRIDTTNVVIPATATHAIYARHSGSGGIDVDVSGGSLTTTGARDYAVIGWHSGPSGDVDIGLKDVVARTSNADSHAVVGYGQGGMRAVRIDVRGGSFTTEGSGAGSHAVVAWQTGSGDIDIDVRDAAIETQGRNSIGVFGYRTGTGASGNVDVDVRGGSVASKGLGLYGIHAWARNSDGTGDVGMNVAGAVVTMERRLASAVFAENAGTGDLAVTVSNGAILRADGERSIGVRAVHGGNGGIAVDVSGKTVVAVEGGDSAGVHAYHSASRAVANEDTTVDMTIGAGVRVDAPFASGVQGRLGGSNTAGVAITHQGAIRARDTGILAWASLSSGIEILRLADHEGRREPMVHVTSSGDVTVGAGVMDAWVREVVTGDDGTLSAGEQAVLGAVEAEDSEALDAALAALPAAYTDRWKARVRGFLSARGLSMTDKSQAVTMTAEERAADQATFEILGIPRAGIRAMVMDHERISGYIRVSDQDPAILAIDAESRTPEQQAALQAQRALSAAERRVLEASLLGGDLEAALAALPADYTEDEKTGIRLRATYYNEGDVRVDVTGGMIVSEGDGVHARYILTNDRNGAIAVTVADGATVTGGRNGIYVGSAGAAEEGNFRAQSVTVNGAVTGGSGAGVHMAGGGRLVVGRTGRIGATSGVGVLADGPGDLHAAVAGRVEGDVRMAGTGALTLAVPEGGVVTGTVRDPAGLSTVAGSIGRLLYSGGATVTVAATGALTGVEVDGRTEALRAEAGDLDVTVAGRVAGDLRAPSGGTLKLAVPEGGAVTGTVRDPVGLPTVTGSIGRLLYSGGATVTVAATGALTGVEAGGRIEALRSEAGNLDVTVAGMVTGDVLGLGDGDHTVTVARGGTVTGDIHLAASTVRVAGTVGRVRFDNGGTVTVGRTGRLTGIEGVAIRNAGGVLRVTSAGRIEGNVVDVGERPAAVTVEAGGTVTGSIDLSAEGSAVTVDGTAGRVQLGRGGTVVIGEAGRVTGVDGETIRSASGELVVSFRQAAGETVSRAVGRVQGRIEEDGGTPQVLFQRAGEQEAMPLGGAPGSAASAPVGAYDVGVVADGGGVRVKHAFAPRSRVYEALPSVLLGMTGMSGFHDRMAAPRSPNGVWARIEASGGSHETERSTSTPGAGLSWTERRYGVETGVDFPLEGGVAGLSAHHRRASAEVSGNDGGIDVAGNGLGASVSWRLSDSVYVDGGVSATWYDVALESGRRGSLKSGVGAFGHAVGVEAGRRVDLGSGPLGALTATPRARLSYSRVGMDAFTDAVDASVSLDKGRAATGVAGVALEASEGRSRVFGSVDVEHGFSRETVVRVSEVALSSQSEATRARFEVGGSVEWGGGRYALQGAARWATGARDYGGRMILNARF